MDILIFDHQLTLGQRVRIYRIALRLRQRDLAERADVPPYAVSHLERDAPVYPAARSRILRALKPGGRVVLTPAERSLRGRLGAYSLHAKRDPRETTARARATFMNKFEIQVDPEGVLPEAERQRRAECARRAYFCKLALRSAKKKRKGR